MSEPDEDRACDWCGDWEDIAAGPLESVLCGDGSSILLCQDCRIQMEEDL